MGSNTAYILLNIDTPQEQDILNEIKKLVDVIEADLIYGKYDIIVKAQIDDLPRFNNEVVDKIRLIEGVSNTMTLISATPKEQTQESEATEESSASV